MQLDRFIPMDEEYDYTVVATNKVASPKAVLAFHHGRGSQEKLFGEAKQHAALDVVLGRRWLANQIFTLCGMLAHNLSREMQMIASPRERGTRSKRPAHWRFLSLGTIRQCLFHRAGRLIRPHGELTLELNANPTVRAEFERYLDAMTSGDETAHASCSLRAAGSGPHQRSPHSSRLRSHCTGRHRCLGLTICSLLSQAVTSVRRTLSLVLHRRGPGAVCNVEVH